MLKQPRRTPGTPARHSINSIVRGVSDGLSDRPGASSIGCWWHRLSRSRIGSRARDKRPPANHGTTPAVQGLSEPPFRELGTQGIVSHRCARTQEMCLRVVHLAMMFTNYCIIFALPLSFSLVVHHGLCRGWLFCKRATEHCDLADPTNDTDLMVVMLAEDRSYRERSMERPACGTIISRMNQQAPYPCLASIDNLSGMDVNESRDERDHSVTPWLSSTLKSARHVKE